MCDRLLAMSLATALGLAGCSTEDDRMAGDSLPEGKYPLTFTATVEGQRITKAATRATLDNKWDGNEEVAVKVGAIVKKYTVAEDGALTLNPPGDPHYWISNPLTVRAWYSPTYSDQQPTNFTVAKDQSTDEGYGQGDKLLYTSQTFTFSKSTPPQLVFKHLPAKVVINLKAGNEIKTTDVENATVTLVNQLLTGTMNEDGVMTHASQGADEITPHVSPVTNGYQRTLQALLVPQQMKDKKFIKVTIGAGIDARDYYYTPTTETDGKLEAGNQYTYNITVKKEKLEVTASSSVSWEDKVTTGNVQEATFRINYEEGMILDVVDGGTLTNGGTRVKILSGSNLLKVKVKKQNGKFLKGISVSSIYCTRQSWEVIDDNYEIIYQLKSDVTLTSLFVNRPELKKGNYYYADGEWSEELWDKPCIGIVFKVGRDGNDQNNYEKLSSVQGYVVALQDAPDVRTPFGEKADIGSFTTNTTDFKGYEACQSMKGQSGFSANTHCACYSALHYTPEAPTTSSGWYLPSLGEWNVLWQNYSTVQAKFATAGGSGMKKDGGFYWSMSKKYDNDSGPASVDFGQWSSKKSFSDWIKNDRTTAYIRPILTF